MYVSQSIIKKFIDVLFLYMSICVKFEHNSLIDLKVV